MHKFHERMHAMCARAWLSHTPRNKATPQSRVQRLPVWWVLSKRCRWSPAAHPGPMPPLWFPEQMQTLCPGRLSIDVRACKANKERLRGKESPGEVAKHWRKVDVEQDVLRFYIAMCNVLEVHVVEAEHDLMDDVGGLRLGEACELGQSLEELTALDELGDDVVVFIVFYQINDAYNVWMRFFTKYRKLVLKQFDVYSVYFNLLLCCCRCASAQWRDGRDVL